MPLPLTAFRDMFTTVTMIQRQSVGQDSMALAKKPSSQKVITFEIQ